MFGLWTSGCFLLGNVLLGHTYLFEVKAVKINGVKERREIFPYSGYHRFCSFDLIIAVLNMGILNKFLFYFEWYGSVELGNLMEQRGALRRPELLLSPNVASLAASTQNSWA